MALEGLAAALGEVASLRIVTLRSSCLTHARCPQHPLHPPSWQHRVISPSCSPRNSHGGYCQCRFLTADCQLLKGEMNKWAVQGKEYCKILEQTAFFGTHLHSWAIHTGEKSDQCPINLMPPQHGNRCIWWDAVGHSPQVLSRGDALLKGSQGNGWLQLQAPCQQLCPEWDLEADLTAKTAPFIGTQ